MQHVRTIVSLINTRDDKILVFDISVTICYKHIGTNTKHNKIKKTQNMWYIFTQTKKNRNKYMYVQ